MFGGGSFEYADNQGIVYKQSFEFLSGRAVLCVPSAQPDTYNRRIICWAQNPAHICRAKDALVEAYCATARFRPKREWHFTPFGLGRVDTVHRHT